MQYFEDAGVGTRIYEVRMQGEGGGVWKDDLKGIRLHHYTTRLSCVYRGRGEGCGPPLGKGVEG